MFTDRPLHARNRCASSYSQARIQARYSTVSRRGLGKACGRNNKEWRVFHSAGKLSLSGRLPSHPSFQASEPLDFGNTNKTIASAGDLRHEIPTA